MKLLAALVAGAVTVSALKTRDADCDWVYEDCSDSLYREPCDDEVTTEEGWWYKDDEDSEEYWVSAEDFAEWEECWEADESG